MIGFLFGTATGRGGEESGKDTRLLGSEAPFRRHKGILDFIFPMLLGSSGVDVFRKLLWRELDFGTGLLLSLTVPELLL